GIIPSSTTANFQVGVEMENEWDISLMVRNVWDEKNVSWLSNLNYGDSLVFYDLRFNESHSLQKPRTFSLTVRKSF
ncbi:MAG TPA: hypothetical protein VFY27_08035, partial [Woeseiaceae bacterium]|nr:hypothetical protein [Woeseiaceae bacterium]